MKIINQSIIIALWAGLLMACGGGDGFSGDAQTEETEQQVASADAASLSLQPSTITVKSDNSDTSTITATLLDGNNVVVPDVAVAFSATGGQLSAANVITDDAGQASVEFSAGTADPSNRVATVTASVPDVDSAQVPIQVVGSSLEVKADTNSLILGGDDTADITVVAKDAGDNRVSNADITLGVSGVGSNPGSATLDTTSATTDVRGEASAQLTGTSPGDVRLTVEGLGTQVTEDFTISQQSQAFQISSPASSPASMDTTSSITVQVSAPDQNEVRFTTTQGQWDGSGDAVIVKSVSNDQASAQLTSSDAGVASVQVLDADDSNVSDSITVLIAAPASSASNIILKASVTSLPPSTSDLSNEATLTATVEDANGAPVVEAPVAFSLSDTTGGGETVSPVYGVTDAQGQMTATFTSGSLPSGQTDSAVTIEASVLDASSSVIDSDTVDIVIGGTAGSVAVGRGSQVQVPDDAHYSLPMAVVVADSNGNAVSGATVSLSAWPARYSPGVWVDTDPDPQSQACEPDIWATFDNAFDNAFDNEDTNENLKLDPGEDVGPGEDLDDDGDVSGFTDARGEVIIEDFNNNGAVDPAPDGELTPQNSHSGTLPSTVTTDENGVALFNLEYLKASAPWVFNRVRASTEVQGTEMTGTLRFRLPYERDEGQDCLLPHSPFNPAEAGA